MQENTQMHKRKEKKVIRNRAIIYNPLFYEKMTFSAAGKGNYF